MYLYQYKWLRGNFKYVSIKITRKKLSDCSENNLIFFMKMKDDFLILTELCIVHSGPIPFAIFLTVA